MCSSSKLFTIVSQHVMSLRRGPRMMTSLVWISPGVNVEARYNLTLIMIERECKSATEVITYKLTDAFQNKIWIYSCLFPASRKKIRHIDRHADCKWTEWLNGCIRIAKHSTSWIWKHGKNSCKWLLFAVKNWQISESFRLPLFCVWYQSFGQCFYHYKSFIFLYLSQNFQWILF